MQRPSPQLPGTRLGIWRILEPLGEGSEGIVVRAEDSGGQQAALKIQPGRGEATERAALLRRLPVHPHLAAVLDAWQEGEQLCVAMELVAGVPLRQAFPALSPADRDAVWLQVLDAQAALHERGLVHGDVKPENLLLESEPLRVVLIDYGFTQRRGASIALGTTPAYASPELKVGGARTPRDDLWALGITALELEAGLARPTAQVPPSFHPRPLLALLLMRALAPALDQRPEQATDLLQALQPLAEGLAARVRLPMLGPPTTERLRQYERVLAADLRSRTPRWVAWRAHRDALLQDWAPRLQDTARNAGAELLIASPHEGVLALAAPLQIHVDPQAGQDALGLAIRIASARRAAQSTAENDPLRMAYEAQRPLVIIALSDPDSAERAAFFAALIRAARSGAQELPGLAISIVSLAGAAPPPEAELWQADAATESDVQAWLGLALPGLGPGWRTPLAQDLHRVAQGSALALRERLQALVQGAAIRRIGRDLELDPELAGRLLRGKPPSTGARRDLSHLPSLLADHLRWFAEAFEPFPLCDADGARLQPATCDALSESGWLRADLAEPDRWRLNGWPRAARGPSAETRRRELHRRWADLRTDEPLARRWHELRALERAPASAVEDLTQTLIARGRTREALALVESIPISGAEDAAVIAERIKTHSTALCAAGLRREALLHLKQLRRSIPQHARTSINLEIALRALQDAPGSREARAGKRLIQRLSHHQDHRVAHAAWLAGFETALREEPVQDLIQRYEQIAAPSTARWLRLGGQLALRAGDAPLASARFDAAIKLAERDGDAIEGALALANLAVQDLVQGRAEEALRRLDRARPTLEAHGRHRQLAEITWNAGVALGRLGDGRAARRRCREARHLFEVLGDLRSSALAEASEGIAWLQDGAAPHALGLLRRAAARLPLPADARSLALLLGHLAIAAAEVGRIRLARKSAAGAWRAARADRSPRVSLLAALAARAAGGRTRKLNIALQAAAEPWLHWEAQSSGILESPAEDPGSNSPRIVARRAMRHAQHRGPADRSALAHALWLTRHGGHELERAQLSLLAVLTSLLAGRGPKGLWHWRRFQSQQASLLAPMTPFSRKIYAERHFAGSLIALERHLDARLTLKGRPQAESSTAALLESLLALETAKDRALVLRRLLELCLEVADADEALWIERRGDDLQVGAGRTREGQAVQIERARWSRSLAHEAIATGTILVIDDAVKDPAAQALFSVQRHELRAVACVPLVLQQHAIGALWIVALDRGSAFPEALRPILLAFARLAALTLKDFDARRDEKRNTDSSRPAPAPIEALLREEAPFGTSRPAGDLDALVKRAGRSDLPVLILGETGSGKELVAHALHARSPRAHGPFVIQNCAGMPAALFESLFFGHVRGAFTGADRDRPGLFAAADGGTLFLDEIAELDLAAQAGLLRVLESRTFRPLGAAQSSTKDVRVIAATHADLGALVAEGRFRTDLLHRLKVLTIEVPPLRLRKDDIPFLARRIIKSGGFTLHRETLALLVSYGWPGNIRELHAALSRAMLLADGSELLPEHFEDRLRRPTQAEDWFDPQALAFPTLDELESRAVRAALLRTDGDRQAAAKLLGISRSTLYKKLEKLGL